MHFRLTEKVDSSVLIFFSISIRGGTRPRLLQAVVELGLDFSMYLRGPCDLPILCKSFVSGQTLRRAQW